MRRTSRTQWPGPLGQPEEHDRAVAVGSDHPSSFGRRFVENPIPFDQLWDRSKVVEVESFSVRVASIDDLVRMKESAGRPIDLEDIEALREIERSKGSHE